MEAESADERPGMPCLSNSVDRMDAGGKPFRALAILHRAENPGFAVVANPLVACDEPWFSRPVKHFGVSAQCTK